MYLIHRKNIKNYILKDEYKDADDSYLQEITKNV